MGTLEYPVPAAGQLYRYVSKGKVMNKEKYCKICGQGVEADHSNCHQIAMRRLKPCEHDNTRTTLAGFKQCNECGAILDGEYNQPPNSELKKG